MLALFCFLAATPTLKNVGVGLFAVVPMPLGHRELPLLSLAEISQNSGNVHYQVILRFPPKGI